MEAAPASLCSSRALKSHGARAAPPSRTRAATENSGRSAGDPERRFSSPTSARQCLRRRYRVIPKPTATFSTSACRENEQVVPALGCRRPCPTIGSRALRLEAPRRIAVRRGLYPSRSTGNPLSSQPVMPPRTRSASRPARRRIDATNELRTCVPQTTAYLPATGISATHFHASMDDNNLAPAM